MTPSASLACVEHVSTGDLSLLHKVIDLLELAEADNLEWGGDAAASVEIDRLCAVSAVADV